MLLQPLQPAFEKRIHFCHTHFPSVGSASLSPGRETHTSHEGGKLTATPLTLSNENVYSYMIMSILDNFVPYNLCLMPMFSTNAESKVDIEHVAHQTCVHKAGVCILQLMLAFYKP